MLQYNFDHLLICLNFCALKTLGCYCDANFKIIEKKVVFRP